MDACELAYDEAAANRGEFTLGRRADQPPSQAFVEYTEFIVNNEAFAGMPDVRNEDGSIQWEAPSNRTSGVHKDTHQKRRAWWEAKARTLGIDPSKDKWPSRTAKALHPTKAKPCKRCGRVMQIPYAYPNGHLLRRLGKLPFLDAADIPEQTEPIDEVALRLCEKYSTDFLRIAPALFKCKGVDVPNSFASPEELVQWLQDRLIPSEPSILSPGAMSNCPDRLDGFHSLNLCCRSTADTGRHSANLRTYTTDRRVFEYWVDGDWIAADRMMGLVRTALSDEPCTNGHAGPCPADHIGPISLGFCHRPEFQLLCGPCNSAKNNRMYLSDVEHLRRVESQGKSVVSWHARRVWDLTKGKVDTDEKALRLSKLMRDNRHTFMAIMERVVDSGSRSFLLDYLGLDFAGYHVAFEGLHVAEGKAAYGREVRTPRETKYAIEQKARRVRVAYEALGDYWQKTNRNAYDVSTPEEVALVDDVLRLVGNAPAEWRDVDERLDIILRGEATEGVDNALRDLVATIPASEPQEYGEARALLQRAMDQVGERLAAMWEDERYVRITTDIVD